MVQTINTQREAYDLTRQIISMDDRIDADSGLLIEGGSGSKIVLAKDTISEKQFIAADDLINEDTGLVEFNKGDTIPSGTEFKGDWLIDDLQPTDFVFDKDDEGNITPPSTENEEQINNGTDDTYTGKDRNTNSDLEENYDARTEWVFGYVSSEEYALDFDEDDDLCCLGHLWDQTRQNAIVLSAVKPIDPQLEAPAMAQYNNIDTFGVSISNYRMTAIAANGNEFIGSFLINYNDTYMDINERINLFINDINTGLEAVGIHLSGEDSTITLVGSVDLKQHSSTSYDTLNVYDNKNTKRVEITPFNIPMRNAAGSNIDITNKNFTYTTANKTAPKSYVTYDRWKDWDGPFWYSWVYMYELKSYTVALSSSIDLGYINANSTIDLSKLSLHFYNDLYVVGSILVDNHGTNRQAITTLNYTLKKNGVAIPGKNKVSLLNNSNLSINGINTADIAMTISSTFLDDYTISESANYSLEINVAGNVYGYKTCPWYYENYYYKIYSGLTGSVSVSVGRNLNSNNMDNMKLTIGTNGLSFVGNNSRYFYTATDGYEMKWDDASIAVDSTNGVRINKLYQVVSGATTIQRKYDIVICNYASGGYNVYLPSAVEFGNGRTLTVIAFKGLKLRASGTDMIRVPLAQSVTESQVIEFGESTVTGSFQMPKYNVQLIAANAGWYIVSYI